MNQLRTAHANLFNDRFERKYIIRFPNLIAYLPKLIDGIFSIWTGKKEQLLKFLKDQTAKNKSINFDYQYSQTSFSFLNTVTYIKNNKLNIKIYRTKSDRQNYLNITSGHPKALKKSIINNQDLRNKIICTSLVLNLEYCKNLTTKFLEKGYNSQINEKQLQRLEKTDQTQFSKKKKNSQKKIKKYTYH